MSGRGREWDARAVYLPAKRRWWWNAYRAQTGTELTGFADTEQAARHAMYRAIEQAPPLPTAALWQAPRGEER